MLAHVPDGFTVVTDLAAATSLIDPHIERAGLPPTRARHFRLLWQTCLQRGMQPSGLVLCRLSDLVGVLGHETKGTVQRWAQFCHRRQLWVHVPGALTPSMGTGGRFRAYLVILPHADESECRSWAESWSPVDDAPGPP